MIICFTLSSYIGLVTRYQQCYNTQVTHTRRTVHALGDKKSSASVCADEFCRDIKIASEFMTNRQCVINKSGAYISKSTAFLTLRALKSDI